MLISPLQFKNKDNEKNFPKEIDFSIVKNILTDYIQSKNRFENSDKCDILELDTNEYVLDFFIDIAHFHHKYKDSKLYFISFQEEKIQYDELSKIFNKIHKKNQYLQLKNFIDMYQCIPIINYIQYYYAKKIMLSIEEFCIFDDFLYEIWKFKILKMIKYNIIKVPGALDIFLRYAWCLTEYTSYNISNISSQNISSIRDAAESELVPYSSV